MSWDTFFVKFGHIISDVPVLGGPDDSLSGRSRPGGVTEGHQERAHFLGNSSSLREPGQQLARATRDFKLLLIFILALAATGVLATKSTADEGYWLFSDPPTAAIAAKYHFTLDDAWLEHLQGAAVRIGGASGSFVSENGLVITNHHVGEGQLHTLSSAKHNYEEDGFYAPTLRDELPCQGMEVYVLQNTRDVTAQVAAAIKPDATPEEAEAQHKASVAAIEKEAFDRSGLVSKVVTLFGGARYDLYQYRKYPDVRLVYAPDWATASFGGDTDNFEFPRYDLDICLFRVYDHGKPLRSTDYLKWNSAGPAKGDLVFVAGNPGTSQRLVTMDEIAYQRDVRVPAMVDALDRLEHALIEFSATSPEHAREAGEALASVANARKAYHGFLKGLRDHQLLKAKQEDENRFLAFLATHAEYKATWDAGARIASAVQADRDNFPAFEAYERFASHSDLFNLARTLVRAAVERTKPNGERLPAYRDSELPGLEYRLFSGRPFYPDLETFFLANGLENLVREFGANNPMVTQLLAGKSPQARAEELVRGTRLENIAYRRQIYAGGENALRSSTDPLLEFACIMDLAARPARKIDDADNDIKERAYAQIYRTRVELKQAPSYPDATGTLRLAYGTVTGYDVDGHFVEPLTDFAGLYARSAAFGDKGSFHLPRPWVKQKAALNLATPLNFAATTDILGGNSGSPVVNEQGEFVGIIFDGNEPSLSGRYAYDPAVNRSVAVDSAAIIEALRHVYHAGALATELESGHGSP